MKRILLPFIVIVLFAFNNYAAEFTGSGVPENPYLINNKEDLARLAVLVNEGHDGGYAAASYKLTADIDLANFGAPETTGWMPIGNEQFPFSGQFDGDNHTISNLTIRRTDIAFAGLFGKVRLSVEFRDIAPKFRNIKLDGGEIRLNGVVDSFAGFLVGFIGENGAGVVDNCSSTGSISINLVRGVVYAGGLVGQTSSLGGQGQPASPISNSYAMGDVTAFSSSSVFVGGLIGASYSFISNCYATGAVTASSSDSFSFSDIYIGGLAGISSFPISNSYAVGEVIAFSTESPFSDSSDVFAGGLVGNSSSSVANSYAMGGVAVSSSNSSSYVGGLVGQDSSNSSFITNSYATGDVEASTPKFLAVGGLVGLSTARPSVSNCYAIGDVTASASNLNAGGLFGSASAYINNSYATGNLTTYSFDSPDSNPFVSVGGLVGLLSRSPIRNNYATGVVTNRYSGVNASARIHVGGVVGFVNGGSVATSVAANNSIVGEATCGELSVGRVVGYSSEIVSNCYGKEAIIVGGGGDNAVSGGEVSVAELTSGIFYTNLGWDMDEIWSIKEGVELPKLRAIPEESMAIDAPNISQTYNRVTVYREGNELIVDGADIGETISVYNLSGIMVTSQKATGSISRVSFPLSGVYLIKLKDHTMKIAF